MESLMEEYSELPQNSLSFFEKVNNSVILG